MAYKLRYDEKYMRMPRVILPNKPDAYKPRIFYDSRGGEHRIPYLYDMHAHTDQSDGVRSPEETVRFAAEEGVKSFCLTDHNTTKGIRRALAEAQRLHPQGKDVAVIPGIEFTTELAHPRSRKPLKLHILGIGIDPEHQGLAAEVRRLEDAERNLGRAVLEDLEVQGRRVCERLSLIVRGLEFPPKVVEHVEAGQYNIRKRIAENMITERNKPVLRAWLEDSLRRFPKLREDFDERRLASAGDKELYEFSYAALKRAYSPRKLGLGLARSDAVEAIRLIEAAGGVPVLAHPKSKLTDLAGASVDELRDVLMFLKQNGLKGIEVYHLHQQDAAAVDSLRKLANELGLAIVGGSDFHGKEGKWLGMLGTDEYPL
jgi:predicted metal-dependent phosphoesterase TrpH